MPLYLNDEQLMLQDTARAFFGENAPVSHMRSLRDAGDKNGFSRELWGRSGEMGFPVILIPEDKGGLGLGHVEAGIVQEEIGRNLTPSPFLGTAIGGVVALRAAQSPLATDWLARIAGASGIVAIALDEGSKHAPDQIGLVAEPAEGGYRMTGTKRFVPHAHAADLWIVSARIPGADGGKGEVGLFLVDPASQGIETRTERLADASLFSDLHFDRVAVDGAAYLGGQALLDDLLSALRIGAAAELVGVATAATERTLQYLRDRKQFGVEIGSFQALQHRAAILHAEVEMARAAVLKAQHAMDEAAKDRHHHAMVAKATAALAATLAVQEGVQMHGGIGMTDEHDIGLFMKRARVLTELYGDATYHADQLARANGY